MLQDSRIPVNDLVHMADSKPGQESYALPVSQHIPNKIYTTNIVCLSRLCLAYVSREVGWLDEEGVGGQYRGQLGQQPQQQMPHQQLSHKQLPAMTGHGSQHRWDYRLSCGLKLFIKLYIYSYYYHRF